MNRVAVYRSYAMLLGVLYGNAAVAWDSAELTAECMRSSSWCDREERRIASRFHLRSRTCLCGIHGFYHPDRLAGMTELWRKVTARAVLGGIVDVRSEGARGEFAVIEEMWSPPNVEDRLREKYGVPVNRTPWEDQPYLEPALDNDVDEILGAPEPSMPKDWQRIRDAFYGGKTMIPQIGPPTSVTSTGRLTSLIGPLPPPVIKSCVCPACLRHQGRKQSS